jgi:hypothetical protein
MLVMYYQLVTYVASLYCSVLKLDSACMDGKSQIFVP